MADSLILQWIILVVFGVLFFFIAPFSKTKNQFFSAVSKKGKKPDLIILTSSLVISWIFSKSITNAANLGLEFGIVGGIGYGVYYFSFLVAGIVLYQMRVKGNFQSIHHFLTTRYGKHAVILFSILIGIRLFNEVWSNSMVIGSYFGELGSISYYFSIAVFTIITLAYVLKGGLRSSLLTDLIQTLFFGFLLILILGAILPNGKEGVPEYMGSGTWQLDQGVNFILVAFLQIFSYPFHDPVMTDRAFISDPRTTLKSFVFASIIGFVAIVLFSLIGVYGQFNGIAGQATVEVAKSGGILIMLAMNFIMITSASSTLDSAFSSFSKLVVKDMNIKTGHPVKTGRWMMLLIAVAGTVPIFMSPTILSATTISGTMVVGLAPVFLFWKVESSYLSFYLPVIFGILMGIVLASGYFPEGLHFSNGKYADLLSANLIGLIGAIILFFIPKLFTSKPSFS
ncbi:sodium:solute symporter [Maribacter sp. ANRC-HE7]|uniref:Sodium:solute symporter n=1 Tax=Maribacter aquimaris TaxID=2737171 RepID=A0ABR7V8L4_9FLAO|nr:sodium:solute symporter [Maribacter aquimaris]MBD0779986.1 sodium:solute symporter [Maribacter aquimaris]